MKLKYYDDTGKISIKQDVDSIAISNQKFIITGKFLSFDISIEKFIAVYE